MDELTDTKEVTMQKFLMTHFFKNRSVKNRSFKSISFKNSFFIKFLLLLSASLSGHSALALPLSSALEESYQAVETSNEFAGEINTDSKLKNFSNKQDTHSKSQVSRQNVQRKISQESSLYALFINSINELPVHMCNIMMQSKTLHLYQTQLNTHLHILGTLHALYVQKNSYKTTLQRQKFFS